jgi:oligopeptide/dipeptide ABC transporter ATP-binding protein
LILQVNNLVTSFDTENGRIRAVDGISFQVERGQTLGIVGESGCGKSVTALSIMRLLPKPAGQIEDGEIIFDGTDVLGLDVRDMYKIRGNRISMIFQEPMTALNPVQKIGKQLAEVYNLHQPQLTKNQVRDASIKMLQKVGISGPEQRLKDYPHQLSGGIRQRVMIAFALACEPDILIADEPTTALDVTIQAQILKLIKELQKDNDMAVVFITHDLGVIAEVCDDVMVMYAGRIAETARVEELFANPRHPYTRGLLNSIPRIDNEPKIKLNTIEGMVPSLHDLPAGCRFENRCALATEICGQGQPDLETTATGHAVACYHADKVESA